MGAITGTVADEGGTPIGDLYVSVVDYAIVFNGEGEVFGDMNASDGTYYIDVPAGTYLVYVNSHGRGSYVPEAYLDVNSWSQITAATPVTVTAGQVVAGVDLSLPVGFTVSGRLVDEQGQPVLGAGGHMCDPDQDIEFGSGFGFDSSETDGTFGVNVLTGTYDLGFGKDDVWAWVCWSLVITDHTDLGDVLFADAPVLIPPFEPRVLEPGYAVEAVVPGSPNTLVDVAVTPNGTVYLAAIRSTQVYEVGAGGTLTSTATVGVYTLDAGADGNLYGYCQGFFPGEVYRITPDGQVTRLAYMPNTSCSSPLAVAPNLDIWIGHNYCGGEGSGPSTLYRLTQAGELFTVATDVPFYIGALDFDSSGQLYMIIDQELFHVDTTDGSRTLLATVPGGTAGDGLVAGPDGNFYIASQGSENDRIFKVTPSGSVSVLATLPTGCIQGMSRTLEGDLIATMLCTGALYRIHPDGTWETLLPGNGMTTPQAMAFNLVGELFVNNDESGRIVRITNGHGEFFAPVASYIPPHGHLAFESSGDFYFSEACPGWQARLIRISPQGAITEVTRDLSWPSGLTFTPDGTLYVAETLSGEISSVSPEGTITTFVDGLTRPDSLIADKAGNLYVASYEGEYDPDNPDDIPSTNRIWRIDPAGNRMLYASLDIIDLAFSPAGELFVTGPFGRQRGVLRVAPDGSATPFADGFRNADGLAFDLAGNLYVSDDWDNSITRITGFPQGIIQGIVTDAQTGQPVPGATLSVVAGYPVVLGTELATGGDGRYSLPAAPRTYTVTASAPGYYPTSHGGIAVTAGETTTVNLVLERAFYIYLPLVMKNQP